MLISNNGHILSETKTWSKGNDPIYPFVNTVTTEIGYTESQIKNMKDQKAKVVTQLESAGIATQKAEAEAEIATFNSLLS